MKKKKLEKISNGEFYVKDNCTYKKGVGQLCNFYISDITIFEKLDIPISFEITLKSQEEKKTELFLISYLLDPISWLYSGFDATDFCITTTRKQFETSMVQIINLILDHNEYETMDNYVGWELINTCESNLNVKTEYYFGKFEDPGTSLLIDDYKDKPIDYLFEYLQLMDFSITAPLFSYMLLSLLTSLKVFGTDTRVDFHITIVGGSEELRRKFALFFTNVYKRDPSFTNSEYKYFHINPKDTASDMRFKARAAKDCVLIAFEPDKRHTNTLLDEIYKTNSIDKNRPIENLLLITGEQVDKTVTHNTLIIHLDSNHDAKKIEDYFKINDPIPFDDNLMTCIYYFLAQLCKQLLENKNYVREKFIEHQNMFMENMMAPDFSETAQKVAQPLLFALNLYADIFSMHSTTVNDVLKIKMVLPKAEESIISVAKNSFPVKGYGTDIDFENAKATCKQLDSFFSPTEKGNPKNKDIVGKIGCDEGITEKRVWYDEEHIFIMSRRANEILKLTLGNNSFNLKVKVALAEYDIIKKYIKDDGKPEYTVHLQKPLYDNKKSKLRYLAFNRETCKKYNLFGNIERIIESIEDRCQIDVKTQKNEENNEN